MEYSLNPQDKARIEDATAELANRDLPQVWIGEPDYDSEGDPVGRRVDCLLLRAQLGDEVFSKVTHTELLIESMNILAAQKGLVPVIKLSPNDGITLEEAHVLAAVERERNHRRESHYLVRIGGVASRSAQKVLPLVEQVRWDDLERDDLESYVQEGVVMLEIHPPDDFYPLEIMRLTRFVPRDELRPEHLPHIEEFLWHAEDGTWADYTVEETERVGFAADVLEDLARL